MICFPISVQILIIHAVLPVLWCQTLSSTQPVGQPACPGQEITFTCVTTGSPNIGWTSNEYIEQGGNPLEFALFDDVGNTQHSPVHPTTVATLINKNITDEILESQLRITVSLTPSTFSVSCVHGNGSDTTISFQVLGVADTPQSIITTQGKDNCTGRCTVFLGWSPPTNIAIEDILHYMVYINQTNVLSKESDNFTLTAYSVRSCEAHQIRVSTVDRCGREGQRSPSILLDQRPLPLSLTECQDPPTDTQMEMSSYQIATIALGVIVFVILISLIIGSLIYFLKIWNKRIPKGTVTPKS